MIEELVARMFVARDVAHREHLRTRSFSQHMALGAFYDAVIEQTDTIVEAYQGEFGLIGEFQVETSPVSDITAWLRAEMDWLESNRNELSNGSQSIANLLDGLTATFQAAIYKLTYLA